MLDLTAIKARKIERAAQVIIDDAVFIESGSDNLVATFSHEPSDLFIINKTDLAPSAPTCK